MIKLAKNQQNQIYNQLQSVQQNGEFLKAFTLRFQQNLDLKVQLLKKDYDQYLKVTVIDRKCYKYYFEAIFSEQFLSKKCLAAYESMAGVYQFISQQYKESLQLQFSQTEPKNCCMLIKDSFANKQQLFRFDLQLKVFPVDLLIQKKLKKLGDELKLREVQFLALKQLQNDLKANIEYEDEELSALEKEQEMLNQYFRQIQIKEQELRAHNQSIDIAIQERTQEIDRQRQLINEVEVDESQLIIPKPKKKTNKFNAEINDKQDNKTKNGSTKQMQQTSNDQEHVLSNQEAESVAEPIEIYSEKPVQIETQVKIVNFAAEEKITQSEEQNQEQLGNKTNTAFQKPNIADKQYIEQKPVLKNTVQKQILQNLILSNTTQNSKQFQFDKKDQSILINISSDKSQSQFYNFEFQKPIGEPVSLQFSHCSEYNKFLIINCKFGKIIKRVDLDKAHLVLFNKDCVKNRQYFKAKLLKLKNRDFTFGIIGKNSLQPKRINWMKDVVCFACCNSQTIVGTQIIKNQQIKMKQEDEIIVSADMDERTIRFFANKTLISSENIPGYMGQICYFFIMTATAGNKILLMENKQT